MGFKQRDGGVFAYHLFLYSPGATPSIFLNILKVRMAFIGTVQETTELPFRKQCAIMLGSVAKILKRGDI